MAAKNAPKKLGKGLSALLGEDYDYDGSNKDQTDDKPRSNADMMPIEALTSGQFQPRQSFDPVALDTLAQSIAANGILQPILARPLPGKPNQYEIIAGERRWRAAQIARLHEVPVIIRDFDDRVTLEVALIENVQREDLNALEEAQGYRQLMEQFDYGQDAVADAVGKSRSHISNLLRLLSLPDSVKAMIERGALSAGHARALLKSDDAAYLAEVVIDQELSVRQTEQLVRDEAKGLTPAAQKKAKQRGAKDPNLVSLEKTLEEKLGLRVDVKDQRGKGQVTIAYADLDQLDFVLDLLKTGDKSQIKTRRRDSYLGAFGIS